MNPTTQPSQTPTPQPSSQPVHSSGKLNNMVVLQEGEQVICQIKRHPIGILSTYFVIASAIALVAAIAVFLTPSLIDTYSSSIPQIATMLYGAGAVFVGFLILTAVVATYVYWQNEWIVTDDSITQIAQRGLFAREVSQVPMQNLEDVTADKSGVLPSMFNYGLLKVESAGEHSKFQFPYCPRPSHYARLILEAREAFMHRRQR